MKTFKANQTTTDPQKLSECSFDYQEPQITVIEIKTEKGFANSLDNYPDGGDAW